jgi:aerobic-type carbon monoxide dehydrogenase small subunit (CoxS/CutS family)
MSEEQGSDGRIRIPLTVNGRQETIFAKADESLLETLRNDLGFTSTRGTCGIGVCGTCTVLVDGSTASSCIMLTAQASGREITTAEGLCGPDGELSAVQEAFVRHGAYQCSFCIPAMTLAVHAALADEETGGDRAKVREQLAGNLCRCGTYPEILLAVTDLVEQRVSSGNDGCCSNRNSGA